MARSDKAQLIVPKNLRGLSQFSYYEYSGSQYWIGEQYQHTNYGEPKMKRRLLKPINSAEREMLSINIRAVLCNHPGGVSMSYKNKLFLSVLSVVIDNSASST